jgi:branched-chain amino acid aminotransferase
VTFERNNHPWSDEERRRRLEDPGFGRYFTDHMLLVNWREGEGWGPARIVPYGPLSIDPAASALHYGQAIFEGFKAYAQSDGGISTFRPSSNGARFASSARRLAMPELPVERFVGLADQLIEIERAWVPKVVGQSLYLRPLMFATEAALGVRPANAYQFVLMALPTGAYFPQGVKPVSVWISEDYVRAVRGGTGEAKCAGNYAASLVAQAQAKAEDCDQVVWLDGVERRWVEEMGGMNLAFVFVEGGRTRVVTPKLTGALLPGVTRDSLLVLAADLGYDVEERLVSVEEWREAAASGRMTEAFACGTAAVITPIGRIKARSGSFTMGDQQSGPVTTHLRQALLDLQHGLAPDPHRWMHRVC